MNFSPKNTFNGTDSQGGKITFDEWEYGSIGNASVGEFWPMVFFWTCLMAIASPILLLLSLIYYRGRPQLSSVVGIIVGAIFIYSAYNTWMSFLFLMIFLTEDIMNALILITIVTMIGNAIQLTFSFIFSGRLKLIVILLTLIGMFIGYSTLGENIKEHNFYEYQNNSD